MKTVISLFLSAFLTISVMADDAAIAVHTQFCEVPAAARLPKDITHIAEVRGADNLVAPEARAISGQATKVAVCRDYIVPGKGAFPTGVFLSIRPTLVGDRFDYSVDCERTEFLSFATRSATKAPVLSTRKIVGMDGQSSDGEPVWLDLGVYDIQQKVHESGKRDRSQTIHRRLIAVLTFTKT